MKVYFISGLGADERVFRHIHLPATFQMIHLPWLKPHQNESLQSYAMRMAEKIDRTQPFSLVGLSFGGMIAVEIAKHFLAYKTVLISSIPTASCMPPYYRWCGYLGLHRILPIRFITSLSVLKRLFTTESAEDKRMLKAMIQQVDPVFIRWAFRAALQWKNDKVPAALYHIHGTADGILPMRFTRPGYVVRKGGHLMVLNRSRQLNQLLAEILSQKANP